MIITLDTDAMSIIWDARPPAPAPAPAPIPPGFDWSHLFTAATAACGPQASPDIDELWPLALELLATFEAQGLTLTDEMKMWRTNVREYLPPTMRRAP